MTFRPDDLVAFASACLARVGMPADRAAIVAELLVEADLMGHDTHGLAQLTPYVTDAEAGGMRLTGEPEILSERGAAAVWDGQYLPGVWLTAKGLDACSQKARELGTATLAIRRSHHIGCLQAYLPRITARGQIAIICCTDPRIASVAPFGGIDPLFTPNPIACGIPTGGDPILIDISTSITTNAMTNRLTGSGGRFAGKWAQDRDGVPTDDPSVVGAGGSLLPVGGVDHGHKGFALGLIVECLTQGLAGHGRADPAENWGGSVFLQVFDGEAFGGVASMVRQTGHVADMTRNSRPVPGGPPVRLPGESALARKRAALATGLSLRPELVTALKALGERFGVAFVRAAG